ncbi:MAG: glycoside hydrolase family 31 protein [Cyclobacteriaceae bacterium]|nr:glycoside hydrolase family 31 protein [Cyclobacteriaceae bacterium]
MHSSLSRRLGVLKSFNKKENYFLGKTDTGNFKVTAWSESIFQITISSDDAFEDFSYAVSAKPKAVALSTDDSTDRIQIKSSELELTITKNPVAFTFKDKEGRVLNQDDPGLGTSWIGEQCTAYKSLQPGERFIGLGEKTGPLDRKGHGYQNWNTDSYGYNSGTDPLYCTMPFYIGIHSNLQYGIFLDNSHKSFFNFGASTNRFSSFSADAGEMNYYFIGGASVAEIVQHYTWLTGRIPLPPKWSLGYQQCRYSYYPDKEVSGVARTFREKQIPADAIVLDIHYMDKYKIFTWDEKNFSNPQELINTLKDQNFDVVLMCDPGIKSEKGYEPYEDGLKKDVFVKYPDGENYSGQVWPGWCHFPDFTNPKTRSWWAEKLKIYSKLGVQGYWNDMNEIATWGHMLPENLEFDYDGKKATTRKARNLYGFQMARSTYEATKGLLKGTRPFNLTRSGYSGVQRYAAVWTGDNVSYDEHMMLGIRMVNSLGLTGVAFTGYDVGGFVGEASTKLFARWISIGALSPFFRGHTMINTKDSEPWSYGEEVEGISRNYIRFRYQLMPYLYSLFYEASQTGMPVQRSLALDHSYDPRVYDKQFQHQYLFGPSIMVAPVESNQDFVKVFFPKGEWYYLFDGKKYEGDQEVILESPIHKLPIFIKGSAIIAMQKPVQSTKEIVDELVLHIYHGTSDNTFEFYEDDGSTFEYESGSYARRNVHYSPSQRKITLDKSEGKYKTHLKDLRLVLHGFETVRTLTINGAAVVPEKVVNSFFLPLEKYDPINDPDSMGEEETQVSRTTYSSEVIEINF